MSSIAYVTDEKMLEYHRLCRNKDILFWRLSSRKKFTDFRRGDLLFFFARPPHTRRKGLIGYAHFDSVKRLSLRQMWEQYGTSTGYDSRDLLSEAIAKAAKGTIPKQMSCLYLKDVVFFVSPIYPEEIGIEIPKNLESYCYLDRNNPKITVSILNLAETRGIDLWSAADNTEPEVIFARDEIRHKFAVMHKEIGKESGSEKERNNCSRLARNRTEDPEWEMIRGSRTDCLKVENDTVWIAMPYAVQANDKDLRIRELFGRMTMYRLLSGQYQVGKKIRFELLGDHIPAYITEMVEQLNHE
ncbi:MAG: hypothetical protein IKG53_01365 [Solobacterium sp.]|nr:hypothetical protein [Solobacterium sp.]